MNFFSVNILIFKDFQSRMMWVQDENNTDAGKALIMTSDASFG